MLVWMSNHSSVFKSTLTEKLKNMPAQNTNQPNVVPVSTPGLSNQTPAVEAIDVTNLPSILGILVTNKVLSAAQAQEINNALRPFRERRAALAADPQYVTDVLADGAQRARVIARETIKEVKQRMGLT